MFDQEPFSLNPVNFFAIACDCRYLPKKERFPPSAQYALPSTHALTNEESFAKVAMGWNEEGIGLQIQVEQAAGHSFYPKVEQGDSIELFFDTRDLKSAGFNTRFCHHFYFLAEGIDGNFAGEITRFRTEDTHPLCDSNELKIKSLIQTSGYALNIFIPNHCLYGYDPAQFNRLGFSYRINRAEGFPQHLSVVTEDFPVDQQPSLWASLKLIK